jgi:hypothetical protein
MTRTHGVGSDPTNTLSNPSEQFSCRLFVIGRRHAYVSAMLLLMPTKQSMCLFFVPSVHLLFSCRCPQTELYVRAGVAILYACPAAQSSSLRGGAPACSLQSPRSRRSNLCVCFLFPALTFYSAVVAPRPNCTFGRASHSCTPVPLRSVRHCEEARLPVRKQKSAKPTKQSIKFNFI